jgi:hypothetical protein
MFRRRHFELFTLSIDSPDRRDVAVKILQKNHVSCTNHIFASDDRDKLAEALDPQWQGPVPYTILLAPGGKIIRRWKDEIDPAELKQELSRHLGKTYESRK